MQKRRAGFAFAIRFSLLIASVVVVPANAQVSGTLEASPADAEYKQLTLELNDKLHQLEELGGGIKPFEDRFKTIDETYTSSGDANESVSQIKALNRSAGEQIASVKALRTKKSAIVARKATPGSDAVVSKSLLSDQRVQKAILTFAQQNSNSNAPSYAGFNGTADDYVTLVAKDVIARELGGLRVPVKGPFLLERFRNLQRISELKKQGKKIDGFLGYHRTTEDVASAASRDMGRLAELSQRVSYLRQQLGLAPLSRSLTTISQLQAFQ